MELVEWGGGMEREVQWGGMVVQVRTPKERWKKKTMLKTHFTLKNEREFTRHKTQDTRHLKMKEKNGSFG